MSKWYALFFASIFTTAFVHSTEQKTKPLTIKRIIKAPGDGDIVEVSFINNNKLVINGVINNPNNVHRSTNPYNPQLVDLDTGCMENFCEPIKSESDRIGTFFKYLVASADKKKVGILRLFSSGRLLGLYDFASKKEYTIEMPYRWEIYKASFEQENSRVFSMVLRHGNLESGVRRVYYADDGTSAHTNEIFPGYIPPDNWNIKLYFPHKKSLCYSERNKRGLFLFDFATLSSKKLTEIDVSKANDVYGSLDESYIVFRGGSCNDCRLRYNHGMYAGCVCSMLHILDLETGVCKPLNDAREMYNSVAIHPNSQFIVTVLGGIKSLVQCWSKTGKLIAQQDYPVAGDQEYYNFISEQSSNLSFSADGTMLAVAYLWNCVIFNLPFEVVYGEGAKEKLTKVLFLLQHYKYAKNESLPREMVQRLMYDTLRVSNPTVSFLQAIKSIERKAYGI